MTNLPKLRCKYGEPVGIELFFQFPEIYSNEKTFLDADSSAASGSLSANGSNFSVGQYIVIGQPGTERAEIVRVHASTAPTSTTITLASNTVYAHSRGEPIFFIPYNQITLERSTNGGTSFSALTAVNIRPDATETYLQRASDASTDVYKYRFSNSSDSSYSAYSDNATASGYASNAVYMVKKRALTQLNEKIGELITDSFLNMSLDEARREVDNDPRVLRYAFRTAFNYSLYSIIPGTWRVAAPTNLRDRNTNKNILNIRIGRAGRPVKYQSYVRFMQNYEGIAHSTLSTAITSGSTSLVLTGSGDFDESGSVVIAASSVSESLDTVAYTSNTESTNTLGGATGIADSKAASTDVWQGANFGTPAHYTIHNGYIYFDIPFSDDMAGEIVYMDYYTSLDEINSDGDLLDETEYDMYTSYLKWKIKYLKTQGAVKQAEDPDFADWKTRKDALITKNITGQVGYLVPTTGDDFEE